MKVSYYIKSATCVKIARTFLDISFCFTSVSVTSLNHKTHFDTCCKNVLASTQGKQSILINANRITKSAWLSFIHDIMYGSVFVYNSIFVRGAVVCRCFIYATTSQQINSSSSMQSSVSLSYNAWLSLVATPQITCSMGHGWLLVQSSELSPVEEASVPVELNYLHYITHDTGKYSFCTIKNFFSKWRFKCCINKLLK